MSGLILQLALYISVFCHLCCCIIQPFVVSFVCKKVLNHETDNCTFTGLLEQICDEKSRPRGSGPSSQPAEEVTASGGVFSSTFSSWGKKLNSALDSGKAKVSQFFESFSSQQGHDKFRLTSLSDTLSPSKQEA